jgi:hypothetical protein
VTDITWVQILFQSRLPGYTPARLYFFVGNFNKHTSIAANVILEIALASMNVKKKNTENVQQY